jgi:hypothetical protein
MTVQAVKYNSPKLNPALGETGMSNDQNTGWQPIEPTMPVRKYPYEQTVHAPNPYEDSINIPPPPPKRPRKFLGVLLIIAVLLFFSSLLFYWTYTYHVNIAQSSPTISVPASTPTQHPTPTVSPYTAQDIVNEMIAHNLTVISPQYGVSPQTFYSSSGSSFYDNVSTLPFQSSVTWTTSADLVGPYHCEDSGCTMAMWVYPSYASASTAYHDLVADAIQAIQTAGRSVTPNVTLYGRCVVDSINVYGPSYAEVIQQYCV